MANQTNPVSDAVSAASSVLKNSFGEEIKVEGNDAFRYLNIDTLSELYLDELNEKDISEFLSDIPASINGMRSSFLSTEIVQEFSSTFGASISEIIVDSSSVRESYENAFMRMMGVPESNSVSNSPNITVVTSNGEKISIDYSIVEKEILNERQTPRSERRVLITNNVFNMDSVELPETTDQEGISSIDFVPQEELQEELSDSKEPNISKIIEDLYKFSYLLIPPIQDSRISKCINEPSKIVPPNFSNQRGLEINSRKIQTSMLESVIRIRRDRLSGSFNSEINEKEVNLNPDDYGILESLFIIRLRSAIRALSIKMASDTDSLREIYEMTGRVPDREQNVPDPRISPQYIEKEVVDFESETIGSLIQESVEKAVSLAREKSNNLYEQQKIIEDSIMALLNDDSEVLDLQVQTQRKSSVIKSHIMSGLIGLINLPSQRINQKLQEESTQLKKTLNGPADKKREDIDIILGISKGIGALDILVFVLALFTMPEDNLTGLLSDLEYEKYLKEFTGASNTVNTTNTFSDSPTVLKISTEESVEVLTQYILSGYDLVKRDLSLTDASFDLFQLAEDII